MNSKQRQEIYTHVRKEWDIESKRGFLAILDAMESTEKVIAKELIKKVENWKFEDEMGECKIGTDPRFKRLIAKLKKEYLKDNSSNNVELKK